MKITVLLRDQSKYEEAEQMGSQTVKLMEKVQGAEHPERLTSVYFLAQFPNAWKYNNAAALYKRACLGYENILDPNYHTTLVYLEYYKSMVDGIKQ
jgi:hypothetical protein